MLRFILSLLFFINTLSLWAQEFNSDSVRPGIKSLTIKMCGYAANGDSTGLDQYAYKEFDAKGRIKKKIEMPLILVETQVRPGDEPELSSWYFESQYYSSKVFDTTWYKHNTAGQITETRWNSHDYGKGKLVRTYDAKGRCIKEQAYSNGKPSRWTKYEYDDRGRKTAVIKGDGNKESGSEKFTYDSLGRLILHLTIYRTSIATRIDSLIITYGDHMMKEKVVGLYPGETTTYYTEFDSVLKVCKSYIAWNNKKVTDTVEYSYDDKSRKLIRADNRRYYGNSLTTYTYDEKGFIVNVTTHEGTVTSAYKFTRDSAGRIVRKEFIVNDQLEYCDIYSYNQRGDLAEFRKYAENDRLVHREVYYYTFY